MKLASLHRPALALLATTTALAAGCASARAVPPSPADRAAGAAALELVETAPLETTLGHDDLADAWQVWVDMIDGARERLDIAQFYIVSAPGERMEPVLDAVTRAAARGVAVRILVDAKFGKQYPEDLDRLGALEHVKVVIWEVAGTLGGVLHAKYFLVDGREAYLGSQNFDWRSLAHIQELGLRVRVPEVVRALAEVFDADWGLATGARSDARRVCPDPTAASGACDAPQLPIATRYAGAPAQVSAVFSPTGWLPDEGTWDLPKLVALIDGAARHVRVQVLSYETTHRGEPEFTALDDALRRAAGRGVTVQLMVSNWSLRGDRVNPIAALAGVPGVEVRFVTIPEASTGFIPFARTIHSKLLTVDGARAWLGTSNWGRGYFHASRNVGVIVESATFTHRLERFFAHTWESPYAETLVPGRSYPEPRVGK